MSTTLEPSVLRSGSADVLVGRVEEIADVLTAGTGYAVRESRLAPEVVDALEKAELFSMLTPARYGGLGVDVQTATQVIRAVARYCGSAAWVVMIVNGSNSYVGRFEERAQQETFGAKSSARFAQVLSPAATLEPIDGGYLLTGRWGFASGILHDDWAMLGNAERLVIVPAADVEIEMTWDTIGMRGSGSHTIVTDKLFVPHHMTAPFNTVMGTEQCSDPEAPIYARYAPFPASAVLVGSVLIGLGEAACQAVAKGSINRWVMMSRHPSQSDSETFRAALGECVLKVESARLLVAETARAVDQAAENAELLDPARLGSLAANIAQAARAITGAMDTLMYLGGASSFSNSSRLGQIWRDVNTGARHGAINPYLNFEAAGGALVDADPKAPSRIAT